MIVAENDFPKAWGTADDKEELYHVEERFLKYCYEQRGKIKLNKPVDILRFFAPIIVSYNKSFARLLSLINKAGYSKTLLMLWVNTTTNLILSSPSMASMIKNTTMLLMTLKPQHCLQSQNYFTYFSKE